MFDGNYGWLPWWLERVWGGNSYEGRKDLVGRDGGNRNAARYIQEMLEDHPCHMQ